MGNTNDIYFSCCRRSSSVAKIHVSPVNRTETAVILVQRGYGVVTMDLEGHGRSDGLRGQIDLKAAVLDLCDHYGALCVGDYHAKVHTCVR